MTTTMTLTACGVAAHLVMIVVLNVLVNPHHLGITILPLPTPSLIFME